MTTHFVPPVGSPGFCDFSTSAIMSSKAFETFSLYRALASVHAHLNSSARALPFSGWTCRCSGLRSLLLPTMTMGTHSVPLKFPVSIVYGQWNVVTHQMIEDFIPDNSRHLKALLGCDRIHNHVAVNADEMLRIQDTVLILR